MDALIDTMEGVENARWQDEEQMHLTLRFAGNVSERVAEDLALGLARVEVRPFALTVSGAGHFERKGLVHSIWAGVEPAEELLALQRRVDRVCQALGLESDHKRYTPHLTLARFSRHSMDIPAWLARHAALAIAPFQVEGFALYESHLSDAPARYEELARFGV